MTIKKSDLRQFGEAIKSTQPRKKKGYFAILGTLTGTVLTGVSNLVYITTFEGQTLTVINRRVANRPGSVVFVGSDDYSANRIEILYTLNVEGATNDGSSAGSTVDIVPPHDHSYPGANTTWVYDGQIMPLNAIPISGTLTIQIYPGVIRKKNSTGWAYIAGQIVDVSGDVPASGACWITLQANDDGTVDYEVGSSAADRASLTQADIPEPTGRALFAVVLEAGYTELFRNNVRNDFLDLRLDRGAIVDAANVTYTPADVNDWDYLADPGDVPDALDQLADRVTSLESGGGISGSALVLLEEQSATNSAQLDFTSWYSLSYDKYLIEITGLLPATDLVDFWMRVSTDGGSTWVATGTPYVVNSYMIASTGNVNVNGSFNQILLRNSNLIGNDAAPGGISGSLRLARPGGATHKNFFGQIVWYNGSLDLWSNAQVSATYQSTNAINGLRFLFSSGNISSGTIRIYGFTKA